MQRPALPSTTVDCAAVSRQRHTLLCTRTPVSRLQGTTIPNAMQLLSALSTAEEATHVFIAAAKYLQTVDRQSRARYFAAILSDTSAVDALLASCKQHSRNPAFLEASAAYLQMANDSDGVSYSRPEQHKQYIPWLVHQIELACTLIAAAEQQRMDSAATAAALTAADTLVSQRHAELIEHIRAAATVHKCKPPAQFLVPRIIAAVSAVSNPLRELTIRALLHKNKLALDCCCSIGEQLLLSSRCCGFWISSRLLQAGQEALYQMKTSSGNVTAGSNPAGVVLQRVRVLAKQFLLRATARRFRISQGEAAAVRIGIINSSKRLPNCQVDPLELFTDPNSVTAIAKRQLVGFLVDAINSYKPFVKRLRSRKAVSNKGLDSSSSA